MKAAWWIFAHAPLIAFVANVLAFVLPCRIRIRTKVAWAAFLSVCCLKPLIFRHLGGDLIAPAFPAALIFALEVGYFGALILSVVSFVWWGRLGRVWILPTVAFGVSLAGMVWGLWPPAVKEVEFRFANLPQELDGYRIVQVSDLHASGAARRWRTQLVVDRVNALAADLVCLTGDFVDGKAEFAAPFVEPIRDFRAKDGVWAVTGNHEYINRSAAWRDLYAAWGVRFLANACVFPRARLALGGVNDPQAKYGCRLYGEPPDVAKAFAAATNGEFRVLLQHVPMGADVSLRERGVDLQLSGHTHGFFFPGFGRLVSDTYGGYVRGAYRYGGKILYVNPGCGQWRGFPLRFFNPQEITLITLRRSAAW